MSVKQGSAWCATCRRQTLHEKPKINNTLHLILTVLTLGIWLLVWAGLGLASASKRLRCTVCGSKQGASAVAHVAGESIAEDWRRVREAVRSEEAVDRETAPEKDGEIPPSTWLPSEARPPRQ